MVSALLFLIQLMLCIFSRGKKDNYDYSVEVHKILKNVPQVWGMGIGTKCSIPPIPIQEISAFGILFFNLTSKSSEFRFSRIFLDGNRNYILISQKLDVRSYFNFWKLSWTLQNFPGVLKYYISNMYSTQPHNNRKNANNFSISLKL